MINQDFTEAMHFFFNSNRMFAPVNCATLTLIPKISNADKVGDFRPIVCCTVIYKVISKILTARLQEVIGKLVNNAQFDFIPGRQISDSILLAAELVKGNICQYNSPRCMIKMDMRKAYDFVDWSFL